MTVIYRSDRDDAWRSYLIIKVNDTTYAEVIFLNDTSAMVRIAHQPPRPVGTSGRYGLGRASQTRIVDTTGVSVDRILADPVAWLTSVMI
jgi:hypothetical protein